LQKRETQKQAAAGSGGAMQRSRNHRAGVGLRLTGPKKPAPATKQPSNQSMRKLKREEMARPSAEELAAMPRHPVTAVLENIRSIHNVGSIFRTADAARIERLVLTGITGTPAHRKLRKTSLGAEETVPWQHDDDAGAAVRRQQARGRTVVALEVTDSPTDVDELTLDAFPVCLLLGNELDGVRENLLQEADHALSIPQFGRKQSLNVSVAFGIAAFDLVRRYRRLRGLPKRLTVERGTWKVEG
jgi:tRNA G18 (ribose-2'-O)-methylase SpoU